MARVSTLVDVLVTQKVDADTVAQVCVDLVRAWSGGMSNDEMYRDLMANARDAAGVDQLLFQLKGDTLYAENAALIVLSAAWNYPELETQIRDLGAAAVASPREVTNAQLANSILYGMFLMARAGAQIHEVAYANAQGEIHLRKFDGGVDAGILFAGCAGSIWGHVVTDAWAMHGGRFRHRLQTAAPTDTIRSVRILLYSGGQVPSPLHALRNYVRRSHMSLARFLKSDSDAYAARG